MAASPTTAIAPEIFNFTLLFRHSALAVAAGSRTIARARDKPQPAEALLIELVLVYCLAANPKTCVERRVPMEDSNSPVGCTKSAQQRAQEYLREHPAYVLKSWRCEMNAPKQA